MSWRQIRGGTEYGYEDYKLLSKTAEWDMETQVLAPYIWTSQF